MKVVINKSYGLVGFCLSKEALDYLGIRNDSVYMCDVNRSDPRLVECVEKLGILANGFLSELKIVEIPDDTDYYIESDEGNETIHEQHMRWN